MSDENFKLTSGWDVDMVVTMEFCNWCYSTAGQPEPNYNVNFEMKDAQ